MKSRNQLRAGTGLLTVAAFGRRRGRWARPRLTPRARRARRNSSTPPTIPRTGSCRPRATPATITPPPRRSRPDNVGKLQLAWKFAVDDTGPMENSPIVYNGTMYVTSAHDHVYALDAATGKLKWEFKDSPHVISFAANRGIGLLDGNVYLGTLDGHLIALNAETGKKVWDKVTVDDTANAFYTMAPVPYHDPKTNQDMLFVGVSNGDWGGNGNMTAYDPKDGQRDLALGDGARPRRARPRHLERR